MKLKNFTVREFRSVWDSGVVELDDKVTCLIGKNESGKTALLTALYRTNPIIKEDATFEETFDYPKREVEEYRLAVEHKQRERVVVVESLWKLEDNEISDVKRVFGPNTLTSEQLVMKSYYGTNEREPVLDVCEEEAIRYLSKNSSFSEVLQNDLGSSADWVQLLEKLTGVEEELQSVRECRDLVQSVLKMGFEQYVFEILLFPHMPKYLYFDEYYQLRGQENLNALNQRNHENQLEPSDRPLLGLINLAGLNLEELLSTNTTTDLKNKLEGSGNRLTRRIMQFWSQNKHVQMKFDVRDAKPNDPEGMREGVNVWGEVYDTVHWATTPLGSRSRGFVWFFSFLAWYEDVKKKGSNIILLLDEPGLSLHCRAQADLLSYFDTELSQHQLIYTTHSPFMIDPRRFDRVRIVQDLGIDSNEQLPKETDGTKVVTRVFDANEDSLFPLQGALGYEIHQTLFIGPNSLVVECPSDMLYLRAISSELERDGREGLSERWTLTPVGGSGNVSAFVALLAPQKAMNIVVLLDIHSKDEEVVEGLYKKKLLKKKQVLTYADFLSQDYADIEDLFDRDFYVELVNTEFKEELDDPIDSNMLNPQLPRTLKAIEQFLQGHPFCTGSFGHYRPARYFSEHISELWPKVSVETKERFVKLFDSINSLLRGTK